MPAYIVYPDRRKPRL